MEPAQLIPVNTRAAPAIRPIVPAFSASSPTSSWSEMPGTWSVMVSWRAS